MKWNEVRKQFGTFSKKAMAGVITASLISSSIAGCGAADQTVSIEETADGQEQDAGQEEEKEQDAQVDALLDTLQENTNRSNVEQGKEETVYIFADSEGNMTSTVVSGWLKNPEGLDVLTDTTDLADVVNVKGDEGFEKSGEEYRWDAKGNDIYYQGTTTKEAPVKEKITYYLDGKEISAKELAGKSGQVKIRFDFENTQTIKTTVNGKEEEVCVPFAVVTGMILNDRFQNIEVENGRLVSDGKNNIVVGFALPGLKESLKLDDLDTEDSEKEIKVPQYVEVSADVEDFALDMTLTVAASSADLSFDEALDFSDLDEKIDTLTDSSSQLADGTGELSDGIKTLKDSMGEFSDGVSALKDGIADYTDGAKQLADGIVEVRDGAGSLDDGAGELVDGISTLQDGAVTLKDGIGTAENGAKELKDGIDSAQSGAKELKDGISTAAEGATALKSGIDSAKAGADQLAAGINGAGGAKSGAAQLAAGAAALKAGFDGTENDPANPGAVLASKQIAAGVKQIVTVIQESAAKVQGVEEQLLDAEVIYVQKLYAVAGKGDTVNRGTVRTQAKAENIGPVVNGIIEGIQSQVAYAMKGIVTSAAENAAEEAASAAKEQGYRQGLEEAAANMDEALAKEALLKQESEVKKQDGEGASVTGNAASLGGQSGNAGTVNEGKDDNASSDDAEGANGSAGQNSPAKENQPVETSGSQQGNGAASSDSQQGNGAASSDSQQGNGAASSDDQQGAGTASSDDQQGNGGQSSDSQSGNGGQSADTIADQGTEPAEGQPEAAAEPAAESDDGADVNESAGSGQDGSDDSTGEYYDNETGNLDAVMTKALSEASENILNVGKAAGAIETIETMLNQLESAGGQISEEQMMLIQSLVDGADQLAAGLDQLSAGADQLYAGAAQLDAGMNVLGSGAKSLTDGMNQLSVGGSTLTDGMSKLNAGSSELTEGMGKLSSGGSTLTDGMGQLKSGSQELTDGVSQLYDGSVTLKDGTQQLRSGAAELEDGATELTGHSDELLDGADELADGTQKVADGVDELYDGAQTLLDGMLEFDREGIQKIADAYNGDLKSLTDRVKAISDAGSTYDNFCGKSENGSSSVKFIIRTEPVKAEE